MAEKENVQTNSQNNKSILKKIVFNKFLVELIGYILILMFGVILNAVIQANNLSTSIEIGANIFISILVCLMMFFLGYISAKKREGINKYFAVFCITLIFGILTIFRVLFNILGLENIVITYIMYANNIFIESAKIIFEWVGNIVNRDIGYIGVMITLAMIFFGNRKNIIDIKKNNIKGE